MFDAITYIVVIITITTAFFLAVMLAVLAWTARLRRRKFPSKYVTKVAYLVRGLAFVNGLGYTIILLGDLQFGKDSILMDLLTAIVLVLLCSGLYPALLIGLFFHYIKDQIFEKADKF